jgi:hypothetical protein
MSIKLYTGVNIPALVDVKLLQRMRVPEQLGSQPACSARGTHVLLLMLHTTSAVV